MRFAEPLWGSQDRRVTLCNMSCMELAILCGIPSCLLCTYSSTLVCAVFGITMCSDDKDKPSTTVRTSLLQQISVKQWSVIRRSQAFLESKIWDETHDLGCFPSVPCISLLASSEQTHIKLVLSQNLLRVGNIITSLLN